jgi:hypothetical protein
VGEHHVVAVQWPTDHDRPARARNVGGEKGSKHQAKDNSPTNAERIVTDGLPSQHIGHAIHTAQWLPEAVAAASTGVPVQGAPFSTPSKPLFIFKAPEHDGRRI